MLVAFWFSTHSKKKKKRKIMTFSTLLVNTTKWNLPGIFKKKKCNCLNQSSKGFLFLNFNDHMWFYLEWRWTFELRRLRVAFTYELTLIKILLNSDTAF